MLFRFTTTPFILFPHIKLIQSRFAKSGWIEVVLGFFEKSSLHLFLQSHAMHLKNGFVYENTISGLSEHRIKDRWQMSCVWIACSLHHSHTDFHSRPYRQQTYVFIGSVLSSFSDDFSNITTAESKCSLLSPNFVLYLQAYVLSVNRRCFIKITR